MLINIVIADDHMLLRQGIKEVLKSEMDLCVVGEAADGEEAVEQAQEKKPDIMLLDINMPKLNGLEVTTHLMLSHAKCKIIILTTNYDETYMMEMIKAGAAGFLLKNIKPGMLVNAIRAVYRGNSFIYPSIAKRLFDEMKYQHDEQQNEIDEIYDQGKEVRLTYREIDVVELICQGMSNQGVAERLFLSDKTVKNHLTSIFRKFKVRDRTQAVLYALQNRIVILD